MLQDSDSALGDYIRAAQIVAPCTDLAAALDFFTARLDFRVELIFPADAPSTAVISGYGVTLRLETANVGTVTVLVLRLLCDVATLPDDTPREFDVGGLRVALVEADPPLEVPPAVQEFVVSRQKDAVWDTGRAGMEYRDLIPGRLGGRFVASHIRIPVGGPVRDYVHFHKVRFQMIYCRAGWARLVYEDQGPPFLMEAGDCVLQPPEIRHRVLEASAGLEVIEIGCPAVHETWADHDLPLPTPQARPERLFNGQRFVRHIACEAQWHAGPVAGFETRGTGIAEATNGLAGVRVIRAKTPPAHVSRAHAGEFLFLFILKGTLNLDNQKHGQHRLRSSDSCVIPAGLEFNYRAEADLEMLVVTLPAELSESTNA